MNLIILSSRVTVDQLRQMLAAIGTHIKVAVDVRRHVIAGGGEFHNDCRQCLLDDGSAPENVWGCNWYPDEQRAVAESAINLRPQSGNLLHLIQDRELREQVEAEVSCYSHQQPLPLLPPPRFISAA